MPEPDSPVEVDVVFDPDLEIWVVEPARAGPAGVTTWEAAGVTWMADHVDPGRLVRCEIDAQALTGPGRHRTLDLIEVLLGPALRGLVAPAPAGDAGRRVPVQLGHLAARQAGWLGLALEEITSDPDGASLVAADALLLARRLGIDDLLPTIDVGEVAELVDSLDPKLLNRLQTEAPSVFDITLRAYGAILSAAGQPVDPRIAPAGPAPVPEGGTLLAEQLPRTQLTGQRLQFTGDAPDVVRCQGLPAGAVVAASVTFPAQFRGRKATVDVTVGDRPPRRLWVVALRTGDDPAGIPEVADEVVLEPGSRPGALTADLHWARLRADALWLRVGGDNEPPPPLHPRDEAYHWAREATRLARRPDQALAALSRASTVAHMWSLATRFWRETGVEELAEEAEALVDRGVPASPFLQDQEAVTSLVAELADQGDGADSAELLALPAVAARARLAGAEADLADERFIAAGAGAALAQPVHLRIGDRAGADRAASIVAEARSRQDAAGRGEVV